MTEKKVSIIIPVYNCEKYIERCVYSIINQTYKNTEIILVDDGSRDRSLNILKELEKKDNRIKVFNQENQGSSVARNLGVEKSNGEFIVFIDSDDFIKENYVEKLVSNINGNDVLLCGHIKYKGDSNQKSFYFKNNPLSKYLLCPPWGRIFRTKLIKDSNIEFPKGLYRQDSVFNMRAFNLTKKIGYLHYNGYYYNLVNEQAVTVNHFKRFDTRIVEWLDLLLRIEPIDKDNKEMKEYAIIRSIILYLLYSGKSATNKEFNTEYNKLFRWLKNNIPNYRKNRYISWLSNGDYFVYKCVIQGFLFLEKLKLISLFSKLYCRENDRK